MTYKDYKMAMSKMNEKFIQIVACSGYGMKVKDTDATEFFLNPDVSDDELGKTVLTSLNQSRFLDVDESYAIQDITIKDYPHWVKRTMERFGYKTKGAMFKKMMYCSISLEDEGIITIEPTYHEKLEAWSSTFIKKTDHVKIPVDSPPAEIGAALRLAFSRCLSRF